MEETTLFQQYPVLHAISYVVTVLIGGVGYKFMSLWFSHSEKRADDERENNQRLVDNLQNRVNSITERLIELETERKQVHEREIIRASELAKANAQVEILKSRVRHLEENLEQLSLLVKAYQKEYGSIVITTPEENNKNNEKT